MKRKATAHERSHLTLVKMMGCSRCLKGSPTQAHHVRLGTSYKNHWAIIPVCKNCHDYIGKHGKETHDDEERWIRETLEQLYGAEQLGKYLVRAGR